QETLLLVLDDLQWADDLSLEFLESFLYAGAILPWLIVGIYRGEEVRASSPALSRLLGSPGVERRALFRLEEAAVEAVVGEMLALSPPPKPLSAALARHSEGNPLFVAEYLRAAVEEGLLGRDDQGRWQLQDLTRVHGGSPLHFSLEGEGGMG